MTIDGVRADGIIVHGYLVDDDTVIVERIRISVCFNVVMENRIVHERAFQVDTDGVISEGVIGDVAVVRIIILIDGLNMNPCRWCVACLIISRDRVVLDDVVSPFFDFYPILCIE